MNGLNRVIISLGSNQDSDMNIECAAMELEAHFTSIHFSEPMYARYPGEVSGTHPFLSQVAIGYTNDDPAGLRSLFSEIEQLLGRNPQDDKACRIPIDISLLLWNNQNFKPEEMRRDYILSAVRGLLGQGI